MLFRSPDAACSLDYNEAWKLLVSVRLAAQCTDARVNMIVPKLYEKFPDVNALADAPVEEIEEIVRPCGLGKSKAALFDAGMSYCESQIIELLANDVEGIHLYTMNNVRVAKRLTEGIKNLI